MAIIRKKKDLIIYYSFIEKSCMWGKSVFEYEMNSDSTTFFVSSPLVKERKDIATVIIIIFSASMVTILTVKLKIIPQWIDFLNQENFLKIALYPLGISCGLLITGLLFRTILWLKYRPMTEKDVGEVEWPLVSVIMPSYNESKCVSKAIDSVFMADYPKDKLEVIAIDDGSDDGTYEQLKIAKKNYGASLKIIRFNKNLGKRRALYSGLKLARGEILITVDTDSIIGRNALKRIVLPLMSDPEVGAVAGRVAVLNEKDNVLTRMLAVNYSISFDFGRAYQSVYGGVMVCPGALTAYRGSVIRPILKDWVNQVFMGKPCTHGEDRHLTNLILKNGYSTKYQSNAVVYTRVPSDLIQVNKMYIRWTRSCLRESFVFLKHLLFDFKHKRRFISACDFFLLNLLYPFHLMLSLIIIYSFICEPIFVFRQLIFLALVSLLLSLYYFWNEKNFNFIYGIPYNLIIILFFWWVFPYSLLTINEPSWLTR